MPFQTEPERVAAWAREHYQAYRKDSGSSLAAARHMEHIAKRELNLKQTSQARLRQIIRTVAEEKENGQEQGTAAR